MKKMVYIIFLIFIIVIISACNSHNSDLNRGENVNVRNSNGSVENVDVRNRYGSIEGIEKMVDFYDKVQKGVLLI